jgi:hypothetical protein
MTVKQIEAKKSRESIVYDTAIAIRNMLEQARKAYGDDWADNDVETTILEMVGDPS